VGTRDTQVNALNRPGALRIGGRSGLEPVDSLILTKDGLGRLNLQPVEVSRSKISGRICNHGGKSTRFELTARPAYTDHTGKRVFPFGFKRGNERSIEVTSRAPIAAILATSTQQTR
jgi:hypothetical protein